MTGWTCKDVTGYHSVALQAVIKQQGTGYTLTLDGCIEADKVNYAQIIQAVKRLDIGLAGWQ